MVVKSDVLFIVSLGFLVATMMTIVLHSPLHVWLPIAAISLLFAYVTEKELAKEERRSANN